MGALSPVPVSTPGAPCFSPFSALIDDDDDQAETAMVVTGSAEIPLADGVMIAKAKWEHLLEQPKDSLFVKDTAKAIWGIQCLYNRSVTGAPCRRFLYKEGAPSAPEKKALSPVKMEALRKNMGLKLDVCLGTESFANVLTDAIVIFLLWKELYYTSLLYEYYLFYRATKGKPFDYPALSRTAGSVSHPSVFSEDRRTFSPTKTLNMTSEPVRRQSIAVQYLAAVKQKEGRAGGSRRRPSAADERTDTAGATDMSQRYSPSLSRQSATGASTARGASRMFRPSAPEDNANTIQKTGTIGERSRRRLSEAVESEAGGTMIEENAAVRYQPLKHIALAGAPATTGKRHGSHGRRHSVAAEDRPNVGVPKRSRRHSEQRRRLSVASDGGLKAQRQPGPQEDLP
ncbi:hypothetical protein HPB52_023636 [Rhipicephalus sanguineus]|uniref:Uncharacterized protein n=1 Tax=Rhipicephalus sanguineus TaxID=34632 RepID=A0A9D4SZT8_RHISA|nr:hypothetical protein HPB52_023636 [Rhipicephalus sanguineus]